MKKEQLQTGFTLIEIMTVSVIIATLSVALILNFRASATSVTARHQVASVIMSDVRRAQELALSGSNYSGSIVCGFGVSYRDVSTYIIYAAVLPSDSSPCANRTHTYQQGDKTVETRIISNANIGLASAFPDIYLELPDPKTYINGVHDLLPPNNISAIGVVYKGQSCSSQTCTTINVYSSGQIEIVN